MKNEELKNLIFKIANSQDKEAFSKIFDYFAWKVSMLFTCMSFRVFDLESQGT